MPLFERFPRRKQACLLVIAEAFAKGCERAGRLEDGCFRLVQYSIQNDHLHLIVEAKDRRSLSRGIRGSRSGSRRA